MPSFRSASAARGLCAAIAMLPMVIGGRAEAGEAWQTVTVSPDRATILRIPAEARQVVLGNPLFVGVTLLPRNDMLVLTGKAFGETDLRILDGRGTSLMTITVRVALPADADVVVLRGKEQSTYSCMPQCQPKAQLGDANEVSADVMAQLRTHKQLAGGQKAGTETSLGKIPGGSGGL